MLRFSGGLSGQPRPLHSGGLIGSRIKQDCKFAEVWTSNIYKERVVPGKNSCARVDSKFCRIKEKHRKICAVTSIICLSANNPHNRPGYQTYCLTASQEMHCLESCVAHSLLPIVLKPQLDCVSGSGTPQFKQRGQHPHSDKYKFKVLRKTDIQTHQESITNQ